MSYAFDNDCANTAKYEEMAADYWATVPDYFRQGELYNEAARVCIEAGAFDIAEKLYLRGQEAGLKEPNIAPGAHGALEVPHRARAGPPGGATQSAGGREEARRRGAGHPRQQPRDGEGSGDLLPLPHRLRRALRGDAKTALADLQKARQDDPFIQVLMAQAYEKLGDREQADALYRKAAATTAHNPPAAFARPLAIKKLKR